MRLFVRLAAAAALLSGAAACGKVEARTPAPVALDTPAAPPRVIVPVVLEAPVPEAPPAATTTSPAASAPAKPHDTPPATPAAPPEKPADKPAPEPPPSPATIQLRDEAQQLLGAALTDLRRVDRALLNTDAKAQYDQAERFVTLAQGALKNRNFSYARELARKAAVLASQLPKARRIQPANGDWRTTMTRISPV